MSGTIESELREHLSRSVVGFPIGDRYAEMLMSFYGFGDYQWQTLGEIATTFQVRRQRVHQIKKKYVARNSTLSGMPALQSFLHILQEQRYWLQSNLEARIIAAKLVEHKFSVRGLFNVLGDLGIGLHYGIYTPTLEIASRSLVDRFSEYFVVEDSDIREITKLWQEVKKLRGRYGIAQLTYLDNALSTPFLGLIESLLRCSDESWVTEKDGELWYMFEESDNVLVNYSEKVFSVIDKCAPEELAHTYHNALHARTHQHAFPSPEIIAEYLNSSKKFESANGISYIGSTRTPLNPIEADIVTFLQLNGPVDWPMLQAYLTARHYTRSSIVKNIFSSPFGLC